MEQAIFTNMCMVYDDADNVLTIGGRTEGVDKVGQTGMGTGGEDRVIFQPPIERLRPDVDVVAILLIAEYDQIGHHDDPIGPGLGKREVTSGMGNDPDCLHGASFRRDDTDTL